MTNRLDHELNFSRQALNLRSYRQELLASNIANADTPHYKARDIDFKAALAAQLGGSSANDVQLNRTSARHLGESDGGLPGVRSQYRSEYQGSVDGNTVNMDIERGAFAENAVQMEALLTFIKENVKAMNLALQGQ